MNLMKLQLKSSRKYLKKIAKIPYYQGVLLTLGLIFGVLIAAQWHSLPTRVTDPLAPYVSLRDTRDTLQTEQDQLKDEIKKNQAKISALQKELDNIPALRAKNFELASEKSRAGLTKVEGNGILIVLNDSQNGPIIEDSIVHAADLRDLVNLLWGAGAEAISINGERIVSNTSIDCIVNTILINNTRLTTPFKVEAIGNQKLLISQIRNRSNLSDLYRRHDNYGLVIEITEATNLTINPYSGSFDTLGDRQ